jgi:hypothetical protein
MANPFDLLGYNQTLKQIDISTVEKYTGILPDFIISEWKERGFSSYLNGLLIATDPSDYYDLIDGWVEDSDKCHVVLRTAFGSFYYLKDGEYYDQEVINKISSHLQNRFDFIIKYTLADKNNQDSLLHKGIYDKVVKRLGPPDYDEVYAFVPAISMGGDYNPDNVQKVKLKEHLALLAQS